MQLPDDQIKQAILHSDLPVRRLALHYFSQSFSDDTTVMPVVIEAAEKYGRVASIHLVGEGQNLPQTESTIQWCMEELRQDFDEQDENLQNYRFALSKVLANADPSLLRDKESEVTELPALLPEFGKALSERIHLLDEDSNTLWDKLEEFCERENEKQYLNEMDLPHAYRLVEALGRGGTDVANRVYFMLEEEIDNSINSPRTLMQGFVVRLAGELRLRQAIPSLIQHLHEDDDWFNEECQRALARIGGDEVVEAVSQEFSNAAWPFRLFASGVLEQIHTDRVVEKCLRLFEKEKDHLIKTYLGRAAVSHFASEAIEPVRQFILETKPDAEILELREALVAASTVLGIEFPELDAWKKDDENARSLGQMLFAEKFGSFDDHAADYDDDLDDDTWGSDESLLSEFTYPSTTFVRQDARIGRNEPCPCGSGKKYKKCCMKN